MKNRQECLGAEFIGKAITIIDAKNKSLIGLSGRIIDETKNTFSIKTKDNKVKKVVKNQIVIKTTIKGKLLKIDGKLLQKRPEERTKSR